MPIVFKQIRCQCNPIVSIRIVSIDKKWLLIQQKSGLVVSMFTTGAFFGAALAGPTGDYLGRRWTIAIGALIFCLGGGLQTGAENISYLYSGRFFAGFA